MKPVFVETGNVAAFRRAVLTVEDTERGQPGIVLAWGQAGRGKTFAARNSHAERGGVYLSAWEGMTQAAFLGKLCFEATGAQAPRSAHACKVRVIEVLEKRRSQGQAATIYMDEADRLIGEITTIVTEEGTTKNEWIPVRCGPIPGVGRSPRR